MLDERLRSKLVAGAYAFLDAGCGSGGSIDHCQRRFGRQPGLGLDWYSGDLDVARAQGFAVADCDVVAVEVPELCVEFTSMMDFLEHLPDEPTARRVLDKFARASRDFLFIRHPSFDDIDYLAQFGLKFGWTDWSAHPNMMRIDDFRRVFDELGWRDYVIFPHFPVTDSAHSAVVPANAPVDTVEYDATVHGPKPAVTFDHVLYGKYDIFVRLSGRLSDDEWQRVAAIDGWQAIWTPVAAPTPVGDAAAHAATSADSTATARAGSALLETLLSRSAKSRRRPSKTDRDALDRILRSCLRRQDGSFLQLLHLLDGFDRASDVQRVLAIGRGHADHAAFLRTRFPDVEVDAAEKWPDTTGAPAVATYDFVSLIDVDAAGDHRSRLAAASVSVKPGGWLYVAESLSGSDASPEAWIAECADTSGSDVLLASTVLDGRLSRPLTALARVLDPGAMDEVFDDLVRLGVLDLAPSIHETRHAPEGMKFLGRRRGPRESCG